MYSVVYVVAIVAGAQLICDANMMARMWWDEGIYIYLPCNAATVSRINPSRVQVGSLPIFGRMCVCVFVCVFVWVIVLLDQASVGPRAPSFTLGKYQIHFHNHIRSAMRSTLGTDEVKWSQHTGNFIKKYIFSGATAHTIYHDRDHLSVHTCTARIRANLISKMMARFHTHAAGNSRAFAIFRILRIAQYVATLRFNHRHICTPFTEHTNTHTHTHWLRREWCGHIHIHIPHKYAAISILSTLAYNCAYDAVPRNQHTSLVRGKLCEKCPHLARERSYQRIIFEMVQDL